ncbi:7TM chemoreceptor [Trinorchestia longiramus]|nr:7TM chemoreceptor [Trinorchestia longiramus]
MKLNLEKEFYRLENIFVDLQEQVDQLMTVMGWPTLFRSLYDTVSVSLSLYFAIDSLANQRPGLSNNLCLIVYRFMGFLLLASNTDEFNKEREESGRKLRRIISSSSTLQDCKQATKALKELEKPVQFSLASFVTLNRGTFASMCGIAVSYTVVAVQFMLGDDTKTDSHLAVSIPTTTALS